MLHPNFVFLGLALNLIGTLSYLLDTVKGKVKPNRVTWFLWALAPLVAFFAQINQGVGISSLMTFAVGFGPFLIFIASFVNKKAEWKLTTFDLVCGGLSLFGLFLWYLTSNGNIAIIFAILADLLAGVPTVRKAYLFPETENANPFIAAVISASITMLTIKQWNFANFGFPLYILLFCILMVALIKFKVGKRLHF